MRPVTLARARLTLRPAFAARLPTFVSLRPSPAFSTTTMVRLDRVPERLAGSDQPPLAQTARSPSFRVLTRESINPAVVAAEYAVRGAIPLRAEELRDELAAGSSALPFDTVVSCNIGNPQQLDQQPLTFLRQVSFTLWGARLGNTWGDEKRRTGVGSLAS